MGILVFPVTVFRWRMFQKQEKGWKSASLSMDVLALITSAELYLGQRMARTKGIERSSERERARGVDGRQYTYLYIKGLPSWHWLSKRGHCCRVPRDGELRRAYTWGGWKMGRREGILTDPIARGFCSRGTTVRSAFPACLWPSFPATSNLPPPTKSSSDFVAHSGRGRKEFSPLHRRS